MIAALLAAETAGTGSSSDGKPYTGDTVTLSGTAVGTFASKDVANAISVTVAGNTLSGSQAGNYVLAANEQSGLTANITAKTLFVSGLSASNKVYDGTTNATLSGTAALLRRGPAGGRVSRRGTSRKRVVPASVPRGGTPSLRPPPGRGSPSTTERPAQCPSDPAPAGGVRRP